MQEANGANLEEMRNLEKELCCVCNGTGIQEGENPMCIEHYKSEVVDKLIPEENKEPKEAQKESVEEIKMSMSFDDEEDVFILSYFVADKTIFQIKMSPESFEHLTNDMIKTVKNYNLFRAQEYQKSIEDQKQAETNVNEAVAPLEPVAEQSSEETTNG